VAPVWEAGLPWPAPVAALEAALAHDVTVRERAGVLCRRD